MAAGMTPIATTIAVASTMAASVIASATRF